MPLNLYRRHHRTAGKCVGGHKPDSRSYEAEERRKGWKRCDCPIYAGGTLADRFDRKNTLKFLWDEAKAVAMAWEAVGRWEAIKQGVPAPVLPPPQQEVSQNRMPIEDALAAYLAKVQMREIKPPTLRQYKTFTKQLSAFCDEHGYVLLDQLTVADMDEFYASWKGGAGSKANKLEKLKGFVKFCLKRKWVTDNIADDLEPPTGAGKAANRIPLTDAELTRIYEACDRLPETRWSNGRATGKWDGEDVKTFIMLLCWTGLRISDGARFDLSRLNANPDGGADVFLRMHKTQGALFTWVDDWLYERLKAREHRFGPRIFQVGESERLETVTDLWRRKVNKVFDLATPFECGRPTPHIFRHTFARLLLQRGVSTADVATLIGDTQTIVEKHYSRWVPERQERLTNILREKLSTAPKPKLVVVGGRGKGRE